MRSDTKSYWGPGMDYVEANHNVSQNTEVKVYGAENGFVQVEFYDARTAVNNSSLRQAWVNDTAVNGQWEPQANDASVNPGANLSSYR